MGELLPLHEVVYDCFAGLSADEMGVHLITVGL
jgi:hypothetical protein